MSDVRTLFAKLVKYKICEDSNSELDESSITPEDAERLFKLSDAHDLSHVVGQALFDIGADMADTVRESFKKSVSLAMYRYLQIKRELATLAEFFEDEKIDHSFLKGSVIRNYYSEPWLRTSCDIDVLIRSCDVERAASALKNELGYKFDTRASHDVSLFSPSGIHVELHFCLIENGKSAEFFSDVWNSDLITKITDYRYDFTPEALVAYHVAHAAKHFGAGGCGVRPLMDLYVLKTRMSYNEGKIRDMMSECGLLEFYKTFLHLSRVWFDDAEHTELSRDTELYLLGGGVYGSIENRVAIRERQSGGKIKYLLGRLFLPLSTMKRIYPILEKHPILLPFCHARRVIKFLFNRDKGRVISEIAYTSSVSEEKKEKLAHLLAELELG